MKGNKSILYVRTDIYYQQLIAGGSIAHTIGVLKGFSYHGYKLIVASAPLLEQYHELVNTFIHLQNPWWLRIFRWKINCIWSNIFFTIQILWQFPIIKPTLIYQRYSILNLTGVLLSTLKKIPLVLEYNGSEAWVDTHWSKTKTALRLTGLIDYIERVNLHQSDYIVVVSDALKNELIKRGISSNKILVNANGVDINQFNPAGLYHARHELREKFTIEQEFVFGFVGTFCVWHGINILAAIIPPLIAKYPNVRFLLIGDGPQRKWLAEQLDAAIPWQDRKKIIFTGTIPQADIAKYLSCCDAFVCPTQPNPDNSEFFGSPTKLFEYLSMAKPIIASHIGQIKDIIKPAIVLGKDIKKFSENSIGILVDPTQCDEFIAAAEYLLHMQHSQLERIGLNARKKAEREYQWNNHVKKIVLFTQRSI